MRLLLNVITVSNLSHIRESVKMTKSIQVEDDVHADLFLLKRIKGSTNISALLRLLMDLAQYDTNFFVRMANIWGVSE